MRSERANLGLWTSDLGPRTSDLGPRTQTRDLFAGGQLDAGFHDFGSNFADERAEHFHGFFGVFASGRKSFEHGGADYDVGPAVIDVVDDAVPVGMRQAHPVVGGGHVFADEPVEEDGVEFAVHSGPHFDGARNAEAHHVDGFAIVECDGDGLAGFDRPALGRQADFGAVDAAFFATGQHDLGVHLVAGGVLVEFFRKGGVLREHLEFGVGDRLVGAGERPHLFRKGHDDSSFDTGLEVRSGLAEGKDDPGEEEDQNGSD